MFKQIVNHWCKKKHIFMAFRWIIFSKDHSASTKLPCLGLSRFAHLAYPGHVFEFLFCVIFFHSVQFYFVFSSHSSFHFIAMCVHYFDLHFRRHLLTSSTKYNFMCANSHCMTAACTIQFSCIDRATLTKLFHVLFRNLFSVLLLFLCVFFFLLWTVLNDMFNSLLQYWN